jgi:hypothetical protein
MGEFDERPVLFAYDGSAHAKAAIAEAARQLGPGRLAVALTVWAPLAALDFAPPEAVSPEVEEAIAEQARRSPPRAPAAQQPTGSTLGPSRSPPSRPGGASSRRPTSTTRGSS